MYRMRSIPRHELDALARLGADAAGGPQIAWGPGATKEEIEAEERRARVEQERKLAEFEQALEARDIQQFQEGGRLAFSEASRRAYQARSIVLLLVVLAVVAMPVIAILIGLSPEDFGAYIAPVTGIAGTVVGYWFGSADRESGKVLEVGAGANRSASEDGAS